MVATLIAAVTSVVVARLLIGEISAVQSLQDEHKNHLNAAIASVDHDAMAVVISDHCDH